MIRKKISTVYIVDDDADMRSALSQLMRSVGLQHKVFSSATEFLKVFNIRDPCCLILDVRMPEMSGLELQASLIKEKICPPTIIITKHADVKMAVKAVKAKALDFLEKPLNSQDLLDIVHRALNLDMEQRGVITQQLEIINRLKNLTMREYEVLNLIINGARNKAIAVNLNISQSTVEAHRAKIMEKIEVKTLSDLMHIVLSIDFN